MVNKRWLGWIAVLILLTTSVGCCRICHRWCDDQPHYNPCVQPCYVPVCCPPGPGTYPAPSHYQQQGGTWAQPRGTCCQ